MPRALDRQEGGNHYKGKAIQPLEYAVANKLGPCEFSVVKYVTRHKDKNGREDLLKARHYIDLLIEFEYPESEEEETDPVALLTRSALEGRSRHLMDIYVWLGVEWGHNIFDELARLRGLQKFVDEVLEERAARIQSERGPNLVHPHSVHDDA